MAVKALAAHPSWGGCWNKFYMGSSSDSPSYLARLSPQKLGEEIYSLVTIARIAVDFWQDTQVWSDFVHMDHIAKFVCEGGLIYLN